MDRLADVVRQDHLVYNRPVVVCSVPTMMTSRWSIDWCLNMIRRRDSVGRIVDEEVNATPPVETDDCAFVNQR